MKLFKNLSGLLFALVVTAFTASSVIAEDHAQEKVLSGTVEINSTQMAFIISGQAGGGVLKFQGADYEFDIGGLGVGGIGIQTLSAVGAVYNLNKLEDFNGAYIQGRAGATLGQGKGAMSLTNASTGVIIELKSSMEGAALSLGVDGMHVKLK